MRLGLITLSIGSSFGKKGYYNAQDIGLSKALSGLVEDIILYKLTTEVELVGTKEQPEGFPNVTIRYLATKKAGTNSIFDPKQMDSELDGLICFSDIQMMLPSVKKWAQKNHIFFLPYIGVLESHSTSLLKKYFMNLLSHRNIRAYRGCCCMAKTIEVEKQLKAKGVTDTLLTPVGLDISLVYEDYGQADVASLKKKYGYQPDDKVLLFIGRLIEEKQPLRMLDIFDTIYQKDSRYKLCMVGKGPLEAQVEQKCKGLSCREAVKRMEQIPNSEVWELYRIADSFVNLNQQEIFGMALLEAMYYECKVVAWTARGPDFLIETNKNGILCKSDREIMDGILSGEYDLQTAHNLVIEEHTWAYTAKAITNKLKREGLGQ